MRLFIAINFNQKISEQIEDIILRLKSQAVQGNFTRRENLHLTLAFLGESSKLTQIRNAMDSIATSSFVLKINGFGKFPRSGGDIYWLGVEKNQELETIHGQLTTKLLDEGFKIEKRPFRPHLTLGREVMLKKDFDKRAFEKTIAPISVEVNKISLMKSERLNGKLVYTEIYTRNL